MKQLKLAIVHDDFIQQGGAEFFIKDIVSQLIKNSDYQIKIYSSLINENWKKEFDKLGIEYEESFLKYIPFSYNISKIFFFTPLFYLAFESFDFDEYDVVFSSSTRFAHSIVTNSNTIHISYLNSPSKMLWELKKYFYGKKILLFFSKFFLPKNRIYDYFTQQRSDLVISNSGNISEKVKKIYQRQSNIIYPFINRDRVKYSNNPQNYYVLISRIIPWKRIDYVIEAFNELEDRLYIIGKGDTKYIENLKSFSKENIIYKGFISNSEKYELLANAKALIMSQDEDFGLIILEALSLGTPIIYFNKGGASEILNSELGLGFDHQSKESLIDALDKFKSMTYNNKKLIDYSLNFTPEKFTKELIQLIESKL